MRAGAGDPAAAHRRDRCAHEADHVVDRVAGLHVPPGGEISTVIGASDSAPAPTRIRQVVRASVSVTSPGTST